MKWKELQVCPAQCSTREANSLQRLVKHWPSLGGGRGARRLHDATTSRTDRANTHTADLGQDKLPLPSDGAWYHNPNTPNYRKSILRRGGWGNTSIFNLCQWQVKTLPSTRSQYVTITRNECLTHCFGHFSFSKIEIWLIYSIILVSTVQNNNLIFLYITKWSSQYS